MPVGVGIFWAGHNNGNVWGNWIWDNWRNAAFLLSIPNFLVTPEGNVNPGASRGPRPVHVVRQPVLLESPRPRAEGLQGVPRAVRVRQQRRRHRGAAPNGVDFWWDEGGTGPTVKNCWFRQPRPRRHRGQRDRPGRRRRQRRAAAHLRRQQEQRRPGQGPVPAVLLPRSRGRASRRSSATGTRCRPSRGRCPRRASSGRFAKGAREFLETARAKQLEDRIGQLTGIPVPRP